jgi:transcription antitermination factor NusG
VEKSAFARLSEQQVSKLSTLQMSELWQESNWYAIRTKPYREDLAATNLTRLGLEVLLPKVMRDSLIWGVVRSSIKPLFQGYLFANFCPATHLHSITYARGVKEVVGIKQGLLPINEQIINSIRSRLTRDGFVNLEDRSFRLGQRVVIAGGLLQGWQGVFYRETREQDRVVILLQAIDYQARAVIRKRDLRVAVEPLIS